jgi:hypothetical protein
MRRVFLALFATLATFSPPLPAQEQPADEPTTQPALAESVADIVPAHCRMVWMQNQADGPIDMHGPHVKVAGYDSADGRGQRMICDEEGSYFMPMLTGDGERVVYTDTLRWVVGVIHFDGTGRRDLCGGLALETWRDPETGTDYAFVQRGPYTHRKRMENPVYRVNLDDPQDEQLVWDKTPVVFNNFQLSADGRKVAIEAPWPRCISAELPNGDWHVFGRGCYASMAPDNSYLTFHMDGRHRSLFFFTPSGRSWWEVPFNTVPGFDGRKIHQPRWSNHYRYIVMTGPRSEGAEHNEPDAHRHVGAYIARLSEDLRKVEVWAEPSDDGKQCMFPDAWIAGGEQVAAPDIEADLPERTEVDLAETWPGTREGLIFLWDNALATNRWTDPVTGEEVSMTLEPRGKATYGRFHSMDLSGGWFEAVGSTEPIVRAVEEGGAFTIEAMVTPDRDRGRHGGAIAIMQPERHRPLGNFVLEQWGDAFYCYLRYRMGHRKDKPGGNWDWIGDLTAGETYHVIVTCKDGVHTAYLNGKGTLTNVDFQADLSLWEVFPLTFGNSLHGDWDFHGLLEGVAMYNRYVGPAEAKRKYELFRQRVAHREPAERLVVRAELVEATPAPDPEDIAPYQRALVPLVYEVREVLEGMCDAERIAVVHWAVMDAEVLDSFTERKAGETYHMELERFDDHPQLESERMIIGDVDPLLEMWYHRSREPIDRRMPAEKLRDAITSIDPDTTAELLNKHPELLDATLHVEEVDADVRPVALAADQFFPWEEDAMEVLQALLSAGAELDIHSAARADMVREVTEMLDADPDLLNATDAHGRTPLHRAAVVPWRDHYHVGDLLLERGAEHDIFTAAVYGDVEAAKKLLAGDASQATARTVYDQSPLLWAVLPGKDTEGQVEVARMLLQRGADPELADPFWNKTRLLHYAVMSERPVELVELLLDRGAEVNALTKDGRTPLDFCRGQKEMRKLLVARGGLTGGELREQREQARTQPTTAATQPADGEE